MDQAAFNAHLFTVDGRKALVVIVNVHAALPAKLEGESSLDFGKRVQADFAAAKKPTMEHLREYGVRIIDQLESMGMFIAKARATKWRDALETLAEVEPSREKLTFKLNQPGVMALRS